MALIIPGKFATRSGSIQLAELDDNFQYLIDELNRQGAALTISGTATTLNGNATIAGNATVTGTFSVSGTATAPTPIPATNNTQIATTAYVQAAVASGVAVFFPSGTRLIFCQAAAPTGWTQDVSDSANNRMFRVVTTAGGGVGGSHSPILNNVVPSHTHGFTSGTESADHSHSGTTGTVSADHAHVFGGDDQVASQGGFGVDSGFPYDATSTTGGGGVRMYTYGATANHTHGFSTGGRSAAHTHSGTTDNGSSQTNWTPRYIDTIICTKN